MSDVYMPGLKSRFNSEKQIEDLMKLERIPKDKVEKTIDDMQARKTYWQDLGRRVTSLRESAQLLYSFQNPFNERAVVSSNDNVIIATATRGADEGEYSFTVKQLAQADRFLSAPLDEKTSVEAGTYGFTVGNEKISFNFKGGTLKELVDTVNRQGRGKIGASVMTVQPGTRSILFESKVTGAENRLGFFGDTIPLAIKLGMVEAETASEEAAPIADIIEDTIEEIAETVAANDGDEEATSIEVAASIEEAASTEAAPLAQAPAQAAPAAAFAFKPLKAVSTAQDAIISMEGIDMIRPTNVIDDIIPNVTITAKSVSEWPERLEVRPDREEIKDSIIALVGNYNRLMAELNVLLAPTPRSDATGSEASNRRAAAMRIIDELTYLDSDEVEQMKERLGAFAGDSSLTQFRSNLLRAVSSPYPTDDDYDLRILAQIGISTNPGGLRGGYNQSRLRGYLQIDPKELDPAIEQNLPAIRQLFAYDTDGDLLADTGVAYNLDAIAKPLDAKEVGGIISLKTRTLDSRISQDKRRIDTMERQLAAKEADLKIQYSRMESAYDRMEKMSSSLDSFSQQNRNNR